MSQDLAKARAQMIRGFADSAERYESMLTEINSGAVEDAYIIRNPDGDICLEFYQPKPGIYQEPYYVSIEYATRFHQKLHAESIAERCFNGNNTPARAVLLSVALSEEIIKLQEMIEEIQRAAEQ